MEQEIKLLTKIPYEQRREILKDSSFRKRLFENANHYPFVWLVQDLKDDSLLFLLDDNIVTFLQDDSRLSDKLNAIITCGNDFNNTFLKKEEVISLIIKNISDLDIYLRSLNLDFGVNYFNFLLENNCNINYFGYLNANVQVEIIKNKDNLAKLKNIKLPSDFLIKLSKEAIEELLNDKYFENIFLNYDVNYLNLILEKEVVLPIHLQTSKELIDKYVNIWDINIYNDYLMKASKNNMHLADEVRKKRDKYYDLEVNNIDLDLKIFSEFKSLLDGNVKDEMKKYKVVINFLQKKSKEEKLKYLQEVTTTRLLEMTVDLNYEDLTYNFLKNVEVILNYVSSIKEEIIPKERLIVYKKLYDYYNLSLEEQIALFHELKNKKNNMSLFYDDFRTCLNSAYQKLKKCCLDTDKLTPVSKVEDILVYKLEGQDFKMLVNHTFASREKNNITWFDNSKTASLSLIGDNSLKTFRDPNTFVILGFNKFDINQIMHVYKSDSFSSHDFGSKRVPSIYNPSDLIKNTMGYNEILIQENDDLKPSYVVCYDTIKPGDISASHNLGNIPLIIIDTSKYQCKKTNLDLEGNNYISHLEATMQSNYKRGK